jgi:hypothetical protein
MATCPTDSAVYQEEIKTIVFRQDDGITIPKLVREAAFELSIDVIIRSITTEVYKNYESTPPESFFGNATLVFQDCLELKVPLKFPRQRIYYGRVPEAFEQWNALVNFEYMRAYFLAVGESIQSLGTALGAGSIPAVFCCSLPEPRWRELPIREAYVNVPPGTQYEIEISWLAPVPFSDACDTFYEGLSGQVDGDKDEGLPPNGIFPNVAGDSNNPFNGLPNPTPDFEQGGFSNSKTANAQDVDPANEPQIRHACVNGECVPNPSGAYVSESACEAAVIQTGDWHLLYTFYNPANGCATQARDVPFGDQPNPNDVFTYTDVVPTTFSCVGTGATQGNIRKNGVILFFASSISNVRFEYVTTRSCP